MAQSLLARIMKTGRLPVDVAARLATETVVVRAEGIWVSGSGSFRSPGRSQAAGVRMHFGGFAVTTSGIVASVGRSKVADAPFAAHDPNGAITLAPNPDGIVGLLRWV